MNAAVIYGSLRVPNESGGGKSNERTDNSGGRDRRDRCGGLLSTFQT